MSQTPRSGRRQLPDYASPTMATDSVEVFCRIKPANYLQKHDSCLDVVDDNTVMITAPATSAAGQRGLVGSIRSTFNKVLQESSTQEEVFNTVALPLVEDLVAGRNGLLFTYGVTGSGKTHTMRGAPENPGILPRTLETLFGAIGHQLTKKYVVKPDGSANGFTVQSEVDAMMERQRLETMHRIHPMSQPESIPAEFNRQGYARVSTSAVSEDHLFSVFVSLVEIYNNQVFDLLEELPVDTAGRPIPPPTKGLREDARRRIYVSGCTEVECQSAEEAYQVFLKGERRRKVAHTCLNAESSRSHSVFNIRLVQGPLDNQRGDEIVQSTTPKKNCNTVSILRKTDSSGSKSSSPSKRNYRPPTPPSSSRSNSSSKKKRKSFIDSCKETGKSLCFKNDADEASEVSVSTAIHKAVSFGALPADSTSSSSVSSVSLPKCTTDEQLSESPTKRMPTGSLTKHPEQLIVSQLALVDLAGSERAKRTENGGDRLREASNINNSLLTLRKCIEQLRENQAQQNSQNCRIVPYRESKLTHLFKNYFDGDGHVKMVVCVNTLGVEYDETARVLQFAVMTQEVQVPRTVVPAPIIVLSKPSTGKVPTASEVLARVSTGGSGISFYFPPWPTHRDLRNDKDADTLPQLAEYLTERIAKRDEMANELDRQFESLRSQLVEINDRCSSAESGAESAKLAQERAEAASSTSRVDKRSAEKRARQAESEKQNAQAENRRLQEELARQKSDVVKLRNRIQQNTSRFNEERKALQAAYNASVAPREKKLKALRALADQDTDEFVSDAGGNGTPKPAKEKLEVVEVETGAESEGEYAALSPPRKVEVVDIRAVEKKKTKDRDATIQRLMRTAQSDIRRVPSQQGFTTSSDTDSEQNRPPPRGRPAARPPAVAPKPPMTPGGRVGPSGASTHVKRMRQAFSPPPPDVRPSPVNPRHRRSQSASELLWIDHHSKNETPTGTVLQPTGFSRKKSVTKLEVRDVTDRATNYMLTHQTTDPRSGHLETQIYKAVCDVRYFNSERQLHGVDSQNTDTDDELDENKGDVIPSSGGGAAVIFNDVETLRQRSPVERKRTSSAAEIAAAAAASGRKRLKESNI